ncbi:hypothetical protein SV7mr_15410 [Stieleria bergensis]|uniref:Putative adhesin Stv domain-containing protein n=1 Tax=Stieleria bergensis TaxID=2528025 RepID=A0A517SSC6_9BACT|nr:hypothetical protein SV7mr_15410 [Planctomycetes bacterium SV_7m_r]
MDMQQVKHFNVWKHGQKFGSEAVLLTHGGYYTKNGMEGLPSSVYFYAPHTVSIGFEQAYYIIEYNNANKATSISGPETAIWNYSLRELTVPEATTIFIAWKRQEKWDWWSVKGDKIQTMKTLKAAMHSTGHTYDKIHFLCCRIWYDVKPPEKFGALEPPKEK